MILHVPPAATTALLRRSNRFDDIFDNVMGKELLTLLE